MFVGINEKGEEETFGTDCGQSSFGFGLESILGTPVSTGSAFKISILFLLD